MLVPPTPVVLDKPRALKCTMTAIAKLKEWCGFDAIKEPHAIFGELMRDKGGNVTGFSINAARFDTVLAAFLYHESPTITPDKAGSLIESVDMLNAASQAIGQAWIAFAGPKKETEDADPLPLTAGTD